MARYFTGIDNLNGSPPRTGQPFTVSLWVKPDDTTSVRDPIRLNNSLDGTQFFRVRLGSDASCQFQVRAGTTTYAANATASYVASSWNHIVAAAYATNSRSIFLNGGNSGTNTQDQTPTGIDQIQINGLAGGFTLADAAIWNVGLTSAEASALARGVSALRIRPQNLIAFYPLWVGDVTTVPNFVGSSYSLSTTATDNSVAHAPVQPPYYGLSGWRATPYAQQGDLMPLLF